MSLAYHAHIQSYHSSILTFWVFLTPIHAVISSDLPCPFSHFMDLSSHWFYQILCPYTVLILPCSYTDIASIMFLIHSHRLLPGISSMLISSLPVHSPALFQNLSRAFPVLDVANTGSSVGLLNMIGHPAHCYRQLMQVPVLRARGIQIGSKTCVIVFLGLCSEIVKMIWVVVWEKDLCYNDLWNE